MISSSLVWVSKSHANPSGWEVSMLVSGKKAAPVSARQTALGSPGTAAFVNISAANTGANSRSNFGNGEGLYSAFFNQSNITKVAFVDGSSTSLDPTQHTNYLIYDLVESTGSESIHQILKRLDEYQRTASLFHGNDTVWGANSVLNHTAGYSGTLSASGGTGFRTTTAGMASALPQIPDRFALMGINREADNDIQAIAAYWGNLGVTSGKSDVWRGDNPYQTFWSYWGHDFHANSQTQRIGSSLQTNPGVATGAAWTGDVYFMTYTLVQNVSFDSLALPGSAKTATFRQAVVISASVSVASRITFRANGKVLPRCKNVSTTGSGSSHSATCSWRPSNRGAVTLTATASPTGAGMSIATATPVNIFVESRSGAR